jgi:predicted DNA-binding protein (UPF0251 family)
MSREPDYYGEQGRRIAAAGQRRAWMEYVRAMGGGRKDVRGIVGADPDDEEEVELRVPGYVQWALEHRANKFTPAQREALELWAGPEHLTQEQMAERAGCSRSAFRKRLAHAQRVLTIVLVAEAQGRPSTVRRGKNRGRATTKDSA